jgi:hypothetical protein
VMVCCCQPVLFFSPLFSIFLLKFMMSVQNFKVIISFTTISIFFPYFFICNFHSLPFYQILFCFFGLWVHNCDLLFFLKLVLILLILIFCFGLSCEFNFSFQFHHSIQNSKL